MSGQLHAAPPAGKTIKEIAQEELIAERTKKYVTEMKSKMKDLEAAKVITKNLDREIQELELKIEQEINDIRA